MALLRCRSAAALIVAAAITLQAFLAGLAAADGMPAAGSGPAGFAVICHSGGGADQGNGTAPDPAGAKHPCCMSCTAVPPMLGAPPGILLAQPGHGFRTHAANTGTILIARRAVRAGLSQAPPSQV